SSQPSLLSVHSPTTHLILFLFFLLLIPPPPSSTLFPYTTLFRSRLAPGDARQVLALLGVGAEAHEPGRRHVGVDEDAEGHAARADRKSTRLNSSHVSISYAVFCLKKKKKKKKKKKQ